VDLDPVGSESFLRDPNCLTEICIILANSYFKMVHFGADNMRISLEKLKNAYKCCCIPLYSHKIWHLIIWPSFREDPDLHQKKKFESGSAAKLRSLRKNVIG
jgi:hypothetical protein